MGTSTGYQPDHLRKGKRFISLDKFPVSPLVH
uniref:Uncharacterized protein n=1 Tax=Anguilla anguilla TaxID=7936 RepID=A0A0E9UY65_ANGAN